MAERDEIAQIREDLLQQQVASVTLLNIVKESDKKLDEVLGAVRSIQVQQAMVDARLNAVDARLSSVDARVGALSQDMIGSFRQLAMDRAQEEQRLSERLDRIDTANDEHNDDLIRWRNDVFERVNKVEATIDAKLDQVIALLTQKTGE